MFGMHRCACVGLRFEPELLGPMTHLHERVAAYLHESAALPPFRHALPTPIFNPIMILPTILLSMLGLAASPPTASTPPPTAGPPMASNALAAVAKVAGANAKGVPIRTTGAPIRVMTFNIRYDNPEDGLDAWPYRKDMVVDVLRSNRVDVAGLQEAMMAQIDTLAARLPEYAWLGVGRDDGKRGGEFAPIFYRRDRFDVLSQDTFWLSEHPHVPGSRSWDAALPRIATWAVLRDRQTGDRLLVVNTHFDHRGSEARMRSATLILETIGALAGSLPVVLTGDFNAVEDSEPYRTLVHGLADARYASERPHRGPSSTWNGFEAIVPGRRIDYIFVDGMQVLEHAILADARHGRFPSDHLPVLAVLSVRSQSR